MGERIAVLLCNHGLLTGKDPEEALKVCHLVENTARCFCWPARWHGPTRWHPR